jgi:hypothetical protein
VNLSNSAGQILAQNLSFHFLFFVAKKLGLLKQCTIMGERHYNIIVFVGKSSSEC